MIETKTIDLINGTFTATDAKDVLLELIRSKINYHNLRNWSSEERFGKPDDFSQRRLVELQETRELLKAYFNKARLLDKDIRIRCEIDLELV